MNVSLIKQTFTKNKILALTLAVIVIWAVFGYLNDAHLFDEKWGWDPQLGSFLTPRNFSNLLRQVTTTAMLAAGMVLVMILAEIDLSVGSLLGLLGGVAAVLDSSLGVPVWLTIPITLLAGALVGAFNGYWVAYLGVPSFIVGLGGQLAYRGVVLGVSGGSTIPVTESMNAIGQAYLPETVGHLLAIAMFVLLCVLAFRTRANREKHNLAVPSMGAEIGRLVTYGVLIGLFVAILDQYSGIPVTVLIMAILIGAFVVLANNTVFGRRIYAIGGNREATRLSGVNIKMVQLLVFVIMGVMCGFAGLNTTIRVAAGSPMAGTSGELDAIASCILGGTSMRGGAGTVSGAMIGALIMASLDNGMTMMDVQAFWQYIIKGSILLIAVWIDVVSGSGADR